MARVLLPEFPDLRTWAMLDQDGLIVSLYVERSEDDVWRLFTGWGDDSDIEYRKGQGFHVVEVAVMKRELTESK